MDSYYWKRESLRKANNLPFEAMINGQPWKPQKGKPWRCIFRECEEESLYSQKFEIRYNNPEGEPPKPRHNIIYLEQIHILYHISYEVISLFRCKRCGAEWYEIDMVRQGPPLKISQWIEMPVEGRVIVHEANKV
jgi:hypothetical protein